ncbi:MAG: glycosyltransferase [Actinobacteria bacterium]|nr:glycosyltransferase [Actinomycetota bacterium]
MTTPRVAIVTASYNHAPFIPERVQSILRQTVQDFEWVIIDDCSTDATFQELERGTRGDPRVTIIRNEQNLGMARTTQEAMARTSAPALLRAESDDSLAPDFLERTLYHLEHNPDLGVVFGKTRKLDAEGTAHGGWWQSAHSEYISSKSAVDKLIRRNFIGGPSALVRRAALGDVGGFNVGSIAVSLDWYLFLRLALKGWDFFYDPKAIAYHRSHLSNLSGRIGRQMDVELLVRESYNLVHSAILYADLDAATSERIWRAASRGATKNVVAPFFVRGVRNRRLDIAREAKQIALAYDGALSELEWWLFVCRAAVVTAITGLGRKTQRMIGRALPPH